MLPAVRAAVRDLDPNLPLFDVRTIEQHMRISTFIARMAASMLGVFGLLGLLLAGVGLYGVIAFNAAQRTREIGLRMALGAGPRAGRLAGAARRVRAGGRRHRWPGLALAFGAGRLVAGQLTGVSGADPVSFAGTRGAPGRGGGRRLRAARAPGVGAQSVDRSPPRLGTWDQGIAGSGTRGIGDRRDRALCLLSFTVMAQYLVTGGAGFIGSHLSKSSLGAATTCASPTV